jgi:hypothetical protein
MSKSLPYYLRISTKKGSRGGSLLSSHGEIVDYGAFMESAFYSVFEKAVAVSAADNHVK